MMILVKRNFWGPLSSSVLILIVITLMLDQISKIYLVHVFDLQNNQPVDITPFFNFIMVWNRGVSYGLFQQNSQLGQAVLTSISFIASILLWVWACRTTSKLQAFALGLVIGGALGNGVDRAVYGKVVDFMHFYVGDFSWYVFNFADVFIVAGAIGLIYDSFSNRQKIESGNQ